MSYWKVKPCQVTLVELVDYLLGYLTNQEVAKFSTLDDAALTHMLHQYGNVMLQHGLNPRAFAGAERILTHLTFEQQYRAGAYDYAIEAYRAQDAGEAATDVALEEVPAALALRRQD